MIETSNGCQGTTDDPCVRIGSCSIQGSTWQQEVHAHRSDLYDNMGWPGICDLVHVALLQGNCSPPQGTDEIIANLADNSWAIVTSINGSMYCTAVTVGIEDEAGQGFSLRSTPNPMFSNTSISFVLKNPSSVRVDIMSYSGRRVASVLNQSLPAGPHSVGWNARDTQGVQVAAGVYFVLVQTPEQRRITRIAVLR